MYMYLYIVWWLMCSWYDTKKYTEMYIVHVQVYVHLYMYMYINTFFLIDLVVYGQYNRFTELPAPHALLIIQVYLSVTCTCLQAGYLPAVICFFVSELNIRLLVNRVRLRSRSITVALTQLGRVKLSVC